MAPKWWKKQSKKEDVPEEDEEATDIDEGSIPPARESKEGHVRYSTQEQRFEQLAQGGQLHEDVTRRQQELQRQQRLLEEARRAKEVADRKRMDELTDDLDAQGLEALLREREDYERDDAARRKALRESADELMLQYDEQKLDEMLSRREQEKKRQAQQRQTEFDRKSLQHLRQTQREAEQLRQAQLRLQQQQDQQRFQAQERRLAQVRHERQQREQRQQLINEPPRDLMEDFEEYEEEQRLMRRVAVGPVAGAHQRLQNENQRQLQIQADARRLQREAAARNQNGRLRRARNWVVTLIRNEPPPDMTGRRVGRTAVVLDYMCGQMEIGGNTLHVHWQGYLEFSGDVSAIDIMNLFGWAGGEAHLEPRYGSQDDAINYTKKLETKMEEFEWEEFGQKHAADAAGGWQQVQNMIMEGADMGDFLHNNNMFRMAVQFNKGIERMMQERDNANPLANQKRKVQVILYYGEPRTGKTGTVSRRYRFSEVFKKGMEKAQGYTGYEKQHVLLLEELDKLIIP